MNILDIDIKKLKPYENNPRKNDKAVEAVANSIKEFGFKVPIVIDKNFVIVCGHTRFKAAKKLGINTVPCISADDLDDEQIKAFRLADNKTSEIADWNFELLDNEIADIGNIDLSKFGFNIDDKNIDDIIEDGFCGDGEVDEIVKLGDLYKLGEHFLYCGDATKREDVEFLMQGNHADLFLTDPPYNVSYVGKTKDELTIKNDCLSQEDFYNFLLSAFQNAYNVLIPGGCFYVYFASSEVINFVTALNAADFKVKQHLVWVKNSMVLGRQDYQWQHEPILYGWKAGAPHKWYGNRNKTTVFDGIDFGDLKSKSKEFLLSYIEEFNIIADAETDVIRENKPLANAIHPTMKPIKLLAKNILNSSCQGNIVLDTFGGSGSTLIACEQTGRRCFMIEYDPKYCSSIIQRYEEFTGEKAVLFNG